MIVLGMVAVAVLIAVIVLACFVWYCRRRKLDESKKYGSNGNETSTEDIEQSGKFTHFLSVGLSSCRRVVR